MAASGLGGSGCAYSPSHGILQRFLVEVMAMFFAGSWVELSFVRREDILPPPLAASTCVFPFKCKGQINISETLSSVLLVEVFGLLHLTS